MNGNLPAVPKRGHQDEGTDRSSDTVLSLQS
jgi:hypothetical protein